MSMTMLDLGVRLRQERESRGLSYEDVARSSKIAVRTLVALENGDKEDLPHLVYTKGFIKTYARILQLDPEELGRVVDAAYADDSIEQEPAEAVTSFKEPARCRPGRWGRIIAVVALVAVLLGGLYLYSSEVQDSVPPSASVTESAEELSPAPAEKDNAEATEADRPSGEAVEQQEQAPSVSPVVDSVEPKEANVKEKASATKLSSVKVSKKEPAKSSVVKDVPPQPVVKKDSSVEKKVSNAVDADVALQVVGLTASGECWIEAWGDGFPSRELYLRAGQKFFFRFPKNLMVKLGNSGVISATLNGKPYAFEGGEGKVKTLKFLAL